MTVHIDARVCKGCGLCVYYCPQEVLRLSDRRNAKGYNVAEAGEPDNCVLCRLCEMSCPDLAIFVSENLPHATGADVELGTTQETVT